MDFESVCVGGSGDAFHIHLLLFYLEPLYYAFCILTFVHTVGPAVEIQTMDCSNCDLNFAFHGRISLVVISLNQKIPFLCQFSD